MDCDKLQSASEALDECRDTFSEAFGEANQLEKEGKFLSARRKFLEIRNTCLDLTSSQNDELEFAIKRVTECAMREI